MVISESCPQCGAERISWLGATHDWRFQKRDALVCDDGRTPDAVWQTYPFPGMAARRTWPVT